MYHEKTKTYKNIPLSILDLAPVLEGEEPKDSFNNSVKLAQAVEKFGFNRYWLAEHHNMPGIASSATSLLIGHIAQHTESLRVGAGGVMLPNHASLVIAEQFGTLESLFPNRIDLGLGRAPGTDQATAFALRRTLNQRVEDFPQQVLELENYFSDEPKGYVESVPGRGLHVPIWLLGSSDYSARLAAEKGLPFSFASHFAPQFMMEAIKIYRDNFKPSEVLDKPHVMLGINIVTADTQEEADFIATSQQQQVVHLRRNEPTKLQPPVKDLNSLITKQESLMLEGVSESNTTIIGDQKVVKEKLDTLIEITGADELIINSQVFDIDARIHSYQIISQLFDN